MTASQSIKAKIQGLIDKANTATGETDTDLTSAVDNLIDGYGAGSIIPTQEKVVDLAMVDGNQEVVADEGYLLSKVTVNKPVNLVSENIVKDVNIGGIIGTLEAPKLYPPTNVTQTKNSSTGLSYISVAHPYMKNGIFTDKIQLFRLTQGEEYELIAEKDSGLTNESSSSNSSFMIYAEDFLNEAGIVANGMARFVGHGFSPSEYCVNNNLLYGVNLLKYNLNNSTLDIMPKRVFMGDTLLFNVEPSANYYLPKTISVVSHSDDGIVEYSDYTYDYDSGKISLYNKVVQPIEISVDAIDTPWLRNPNVSLEEPLLLINYIDPNAERTSVLYNGEILIENIEDNQKGLIDYSYTSKAPNATYGFSKQTDGYYRTTNQNTYTTCIARLNLTMKTAGSITINYVNYGYSNTTYGIVGKVDCELSNSYSIDINTSSSTNVYTTFAGSNSTNAKTLTMNVPQGEHFIDFKFRRHNQSSKKYYFSFMLATQPSELTAYNICELLPEYGIYPIEIQSFADGYTESDLITLDVDYQPIAIVTDGILTVQNIVNGATAINLYIDNELVDTIPYDSAENFSVPLDSYTEDISDIHCISISVIGEGIADNRSENVYDYLYTANTVRPIYGVGGLGASAADLTRTDDAINLTYAINSDGTVISDFDNLFPWNKTKIVYDEDGNKFVEMPTMYFRVNSSNPTSTILADIAVSEVPKLGENGWYKVEPFCYGCYGGSVDYSTNKLVSKTSKTRTASLTRADFRSLAASNGDNYHQLDLYHITVMRMLWWIEWATKNSQSILTGRCNGSGTAGGKTYRPTGGTDSLTTPTGFETTYGQMRWHYIEDFLGNYLEWIDGVCEQGKGNKNYVTSNPAYFSDTTTSMEILPYSNSNYVYGYDTISHMGWSANHPFMSTQCNTYNYATDTYFCDTRSSEGSTSSPCLAYGQYAESAGTGCGITYHFYSSATKNYAYVGGRLMHAGTIDNTQT